MFQAYQYQKYLGYNEETQKYSYLYKIIDSDFEDGMRIGYGAEVGSAERAVIEIYEKRNLPVAPNLALLLQFIHNAYGTKISDLIKWNKQYNEKYLKYADEVDKLMIWI